MQKKNKKVSGDHNADWVLLGFLSPPEDKALAMLVAEQDGENVKAEITKLLKAKAKDLGIMLKDGQIAPAWKDRFEIYTARVRMNKKRRQTNAD